MLDSSMPYTALRLSVAISSAVPRARAAATATAPDSAGLTPPLPLERAHKFAPFGRPMDVLNFSKRLTAREPLAATATFKCPSVYVNVPAALVSCSAASASPAVEFDVFVADRCSWLRCPPSWRSTTSGAGASQQGIAVQCKNKTARAAAGASREMSSLECGM